MFLLFLLPLSLEKETLLLVENATFLPSLQPKGKKRGTTLSPVCWYLCLRMPFYCGRSPNACSVAC